MTRRALLVAMILGLTLLSRPGLARPRAKVLYMFATAHSVEGITASGTWSRPGTAAADPAVLPLGSKVRVLGAGAYSGDYSIEDTGSKVGPRKIDIYMPSNAEAKKFGKQRVKVIVLAYGTPKA